jgi:uncharacterized membrane protein
MSVLVASFAIASLATSVTASAAAANNKQRSPIARNGVDTAHRLYNYAGTEPFQSVRFARPGYTENHDAWMNW